MKKNDSPPPADPVWTVRFTAFSGIVNCQLQLVGRQGDVLNSLYSAYPILEMQFRQLWDTPITKRPDNIIDGIFAVQRMMIDRSLTEYSDAYLQVAKE